MGMVTEIKEMQIECPSCSTANKIEGAENLACQKCKKNFLGYIFKKKAFVSASVAFVAGILGTYHAERYIYDAHRYPIRFEC
jgi:ribosomal protein L37AE/L43A